MTEVQQKELNEKLFDAAIHGHIDLVESLIEAGADVNYSDGKISILTGVCGYNENLVGSLKDSIERSVDMNAKRVSSLEMFKFLVDKGADISDSKILHNACNYCNLGIVKYLIEELGVNVNKKNERNETIFDLAHRLSDPNHILVPYTSEARGEICRYLEQLKTKTEDTNNRMDITWI